MTRSSFLTWDTIPPNPFARAPRARDRAPAGTVPGRPADYCPGAHRGAYVPECWTGSRIAAGRHTRTAPLERPNYGQVGV